MEASLAASVDAKDGARAPTLTYCTNVHPGETLAEVERSLERFAVPLRRSLVPDVFPPDPPFPLGLYLSAASARELRDRERLARFREFLEERRLRVVTLNCFPYGGFHAERVKLEVYRPTWLEDARVEFTIDAARALASLLPPGAVAAISTLPGSCKQFGHGDSIQRAIAANLGRVAAALAKVRAETGREIVLSLEPEPFATLATVTEAVAFLREHAFGPAGLEAIVAAGIARPAAETELRRHLGLCIDTCHLAVEFEEPAGVLEVVSQAGIRVGKVQLSSALVVDGPGIGSVGRTELARFAEPRYLHQVCGRTAEDRLERFLDLPEFLECPDSFDEARVHFHVPIERERIGPLRTSRPILAATCEEALRRRVTDLFEVETYTFPLLPGPLVPGVPGQADPLVEGLAAELRFASGLVIGTRTNEHPTSR